MKKRVVDTTQPPDEVEGVTESERFRVSVVTDTDTLSFLPPGGEGDPQGRVPPYLDNDHVFVVTPPTSGTNTLRRVTSLCP